MGLGDREGPAARWEGDRDLPVRLVGHEGPGLAARHRGVQDDEVAVLDAVVDRPAQVAERRPQCLAGIEGFEAVRGPASESSFGCDSSSQDRNVVAMSSSESSVYPESECECAFISVRYTSLKVSSVQRPQPHTVLPSLWAIVTMGI